MAAVPSLMQRFAQDRVGSVSAIPLSLVVVVGRDDVIYAEPRIIVGRGGQEHSKKLKQASEGIYGRGKELFAAC